MRFSFPILNWYLRILLRTTAAITVIILPMAGLILLVSWCEKLSTPLGVRYRAQVVTVPGYLHCYLVRINSRGEAVGVVWDSVGSGKTFPFLWKAGTATPLLVPEDIIAAAPTDIDDQGEIVGYGEDRTGRFFRMRWEDGIGVITGRLNDDFLPPLLETLETCPTDPEVGIFQLYTSQFLFFDPSVWARERKPFPLPIGFDTAVAYDSNDQGHEAGSIGNGDSCYPALWKNWVVKRLSRDSGAAFSINNRGQVAGYGIGADRTGAKLWADGREIFLRDVTEQGDQLRPLVAFGINDSGVIVGWSRRDYEDRGFILTPIQK